MSAIWCCDDHPELVCVCVCCSVCIGVVHQIYSWTARCANIRVAIVESMACQRWPAHHTDDFSYPVPICASSFISWMVFCCALLWWIYSVKWYQVCTYISTIHVYRPVYLNFAARLSTCDRQIEELGKKMRLNELRMRSCCFTRCVQCGVCHESSAGCEVAWFNRDWDPLGISTDGSLRTVCVCVSATHSVCTCTSDWMRNMCIDKVLITITTLGAYSCVFTGQAFERNNLFCPEMMWTGWQNTQTPSTHPRDVSVNLGGVCVCVEQERVPSAQALYMKFCTAEARWNIFNLDPTIED